VGPGEGESGPGDEGPSTWGILPLFSCNQSSFSDATIFENLINALGVVVAAGMSTQAAVWQGGAQEFGDQATMEGYTPSLVAGSRCSRLLLVQSSWLSVRVPVARHTLDSDEDASVVE
jgi:hypothetical protein